MKKIVFFAVMVVTVIIYSIVYAQTSYAASGVCDVGGNASTGGDVACGTNNRQCTNSSGKACICDIDPGCGTPTTVCTLNRQQQCDELADSTSCTNIDWRGCDPCFFSGDYIGGRGWCKWTQYPTCNTGCTNWQSTSCSGATYNTCSNNAKMDWSCQYTTLNNGSDPCNPSGYVYNHTDVCTIKNCDSNRGYICSNSGVCIPTYIISGTVYDSPNDNTSERGSIRGDVTVKITGGVTATATAIGTDRDGNSTYSFTVTAGTYNVAVISVPNDEGYGAPAHVSTGNFSVNSNTPNKNLWVIPTKIAGTIFLADSSGGCSGIATAPNIGTNNISIGIGGHSFTPTLNGNIYSFDTIQYPGSYTINLNLAGPNHHYVLATGTGCSSYPGIRSITALSPYNNSFTHQNFYIAPLYVSGNVYEDTNHSGSINSGDALIPNILVHAYMSGGSCNGQVITVNGFYKIQNLCASTNSNNSDIPYSVNTKPMPSNSAYYYLDPLSQWQGLPPKEGADLLLGKYEHISGALWLDKDGDCFAANSGYFNDHSKRWTGGGLTISSNGGSVKSIDGGSAGYTNYTLSNFTTLTGTNYTLNIGLPANYTLSPCSRTAYFDRTGSNSIQTTPARAGNHADFFIKPPDAPSINGNVCMDDGSGDPDHNCKDSTGQDLSGYSSTGNAKVYPVSDSRPCDEGKFVDPSNPCTIDTRTYNWANQEDLITAYGKFYHWDGGNTSDVIDDSNTLQNFASNNRWSYSNFSGTTLLNYGPCYDPVAKVLRNPCKFDTHVINWNDGQTDWRKHQESITAYGRTWYWNSGNYGAANIGPSSANDLNILTDNPRWNYHSSSTNYGPCWDPVNNHLRDGSAGTDVCKFDTRIYNWTSGSNGNAEGITAYHRYWYWDGTSGNTPVGIYNAAELKSLGGGWAKICSGHNPCDIDTRVYNWTAGSNGHAESVTAYNKDWFWDGTQGSNPTINGVYLSSLGGRWDNDLLPSPTPPAPPLDSYDTHNVINITPAVSYWTNINLTDPRYKITYPVSAGAQCNPTFSSCRAAITSALIGPVTQNFSVWCVTGHCHSISGNVFIDNGTAPGDANNGRKNNNELGFSGATITITDSSGYSIAIQSASNGDYKVDGLVDSVAGEKYIVSASNITGYSFTGATSYSATFKNPGSPQCAVSPGWDGECDSGNINAINLNFGINLPQGWEQFACGDAYQNSFHPPSATCNTFPMTNNSNYCSTSHGIAVSKGSLTGNFAADPNWKVEGQSAGSVHNSYTNLWDKAVQNGIDLTDPLNQLSESNFIPTSPSLDFSKPHGIYYLIPNNGSFTISGNNSDPSLATINFLGGNYIFLVNGDLNINSKITVSSDATVTFAVKGHIYVSGLVGENASLSNPDIEGFYVADGNFDVKSSIGSICSGSATDKRLNVRGTVIVDANLDGTGSFINERVLCGNSGRVPNSCNPSFTVTQRPDFILNAPEFLETKGFTWQEVAP